MSYQVLARKWRPRTFHELIGQTHVSRALINALDQDRLHHAYLFTGTRGVGKTTIARILAKCLNCEQGVSSTPCGTCATCRAIDEGRFVDLIEVDAASRTKVEDTRELLDNVQYAPTQGRYKVYLIDEVHMLSSHSFNALLKTLEEPPPHVKFLLATTDPQKLPITVLSRCLQFALKAMSPDNIVSHLERILAAEQVTFETPALWLLARAASGSMRDALSLTDQAIAFGQGRIDERDVATMLGTLDHRHLMTLAEALAQVDATHLLNGVSALAEQSPDFSAVLDGLCELFHQLAIAQMVPEAISNAHGDREIVMGLAQRFTAEDVQLYYQIALQGRQDMTSAPDPRAALEMTLLRMLAFRPQGVPAPAQVPLPMSGTQVTPPSPAAPAPSAPDEAVTAAPARPEPSASVDAAPTAPVATSPNNTNTAPPVAPAPVTAPDSPATPQAGDASPPWDMPGDDDDDSEPVPDNGYADMMAQQVWDEQANSPEVPETSSKKPEPVPVADDEIGTALPDPGTPFDHAGWLSLFPRLQLGGLTGNVIAHTVLEHDDGQCLRLRLDPSQAAMNAEVHVRRLMSVLEGLGYPRQVEIEPGDIPSGIETPQARRVRHQAERQARAIEALRNDPHIQLFQQHFEARLIEQSVVSLEHATSVDGASKR